MKYSFTIASLVFTTIMLTVACKSSHDVYGDKVKDPFSGSKYESNKKYFRAVGKGKSMKDNIARKKADVDAKSILAGQVNVTMKEVSDAYMAQNETANAGEIYEKFQDLSRQVVNTQLADLRKFDETKYFDGTDYTVFVAYEIKKKSMFKFMKKQAKTESYVDKKTAEAIEAILDAQIQAAEDD